MQNVEQSGPRQDIPGEQLLPELLTGEDIRTKMQQLVVDYGTESLELSPSEDRLHGIANQLEELKNRLQELTTVEDQVYGYNDSAVNHINEEVLDEKANLIDEKGQRERLTPEEAVARYNAAAVAHGENAPELAEYAAVVDNAYNNQPEVTNEDDEDKGITIPVRRSPGAVGGVKLPGRWREESGEPEEPEGPEELDESVSDLTRKALKLERLADEWARGVRTRRGIQRARAADRAARRAEGDASGVEAEGNDSVQDSDIESSVDAPPVNEADAGDSPASKPETSPETPPVAEVDAEPEEVLPDPPTPEELKDLLGIVLEARKVVDESLENYYAIKETSGADSPEADGAYSAYKKLQTAYGKHFNRYIKSFEYARRQASDEYLKAVEEQGKDSESANIRYEIYLKAADQYTEAYKAAVVPGSSSPEAEVPPEIVEPTGDVNVEQGAQAAPEAEELPSFLSAETPRSLMEDIDPGTPPVFLRPKGWKPSEEPVNTRPTEEDLILNEKKELKRRRHEQANTADAIPRWEGEGGAPVPEQAAKPVEEAAEAQPIDPEHPFPEYSVGGELTPQQRETLSSELPVVSRSGVFEQALHGDDAYVSLPEMGIFGVFDGVGGDSHGGDAARDTAAYIKECSQQVSTDADVPSALNWVRNSLNVASEDINQKYAGGGNTTATLCRIVEHDGRKSVVWASVGDSRLYLLRDGVMSMITRDEGEGRQITNAIGIGEVKQSGSFEVQSGDRLVLVTDGVTGDYGTDIMDEQELARIVSTHDDPKEAAQALVEQARKRDDRTALVIEL